MNKTKIAFSIGIALAVLAVLTAPAMGYGSEAWLVPEDSTGEYGEADVLVYFNFTESVGETVSGQDDIYYDKNCVNIVTIDQSMSAFNWNTHNWFNDSYHGGGWRPWLSPTHTCVRIQWENPSPIAPGSYTYAVLTLRCNCSSGCGSDLLHGYNEMNNEMGDPITGGYIFYNGTYTCTGAPMPDLVITEKNETLLEDGTFTVTYTIANTGDSDAGASTTSITADGQNASDPVPALNASENYTNTVGPFDCPCGETLNVTVCADNGNVVAESNETNNCLSNELTCQPCPGKPDLVIADIWCKKVRTNTYEIYYNITNIGNADASGIVSNLTVNGSATKKKSRVKSLAAEVTSIGKPFTYRSKTLPPYTIKVCADWWDRIIESDETNNCLEVTGVTCPEA